MQQFQLRHKSRQKEGTRKKEADEKVRNKKHTEVVNGN